MLIYKIIILMKTGKFMEAKNEKELSDRSGLRKLCK